jgi:hypothetical protein
MSLAPEKSVVVHFGPKNPHSTYFANGCIINSKECVRDLGIWIDKDLNFSFHMKKTHDLAMLRSFQLLKTFSFHSLKYWALLFKMYVLPILDYCSELYCPDFNTLNCKLLEKPLRKFSRLIFTRLNIPFTDYEDRITQMCITTLSKRRLDSDLIYFFKCCNNLCHQPSFSLFCKKSTLPRNKFRYNGLYPNCSSYYDRVLPIWNKISHLIDDTTKLNQFKTLIKNIQESFFFN